MCAPKLIYRLTIAQRVYLLQRGAIAQNDITPSEVKAAVQWFW